MGLLALVALVGPLRVARAAIDNSLWIDEIASFMLASHGLSEIVDHGAVDTNPPGYFVVLKAWLKAARWAGAEPGVLWARLPGTLCWLALAVAAWMAGRRLGGASFSSALAWAVAAGAYAAVQANDARGYAISSVALFVCLGVLAVQYGECGKGPAGEGPPPPALVERATLLLWLLYAVAASAAMWTHLLAALVMVLLGFAWLVLALAVRRRCPSFLYLGGLAHLMAAASYLPWLLHLRAELASLHESAVGWMTPATVPNLLAVFAYWYPFGRIAGPEQPGWQLYDSAGALSLLTPVGAALWVARRGGRESGRPGRDDRRERKQQDPRPLLVLALCGFGVALLFAGILWALQRFAGMTVFFAPRYPALTAALWAAGLAGLAAWAVERAGWLRSRVWVLLLPWLACSALGQLWVIGAERTGGLRAMRAHFAPLLPPAGARLYVLPDDLLPFFRRTFAGFDLRPVSELPCALRAVSPETAVTVADLNSWHVLDHPRALVARHLIAGGELAARVERASFPDWRPDFNLYRLSSIARAKAGELCARGGFEPAGWDDPPRALASATAEAQRYARGWSFPEVGPDLRIRRWGARANAEVRFDRPLAAGRYKLHYFGYRAGFPQEVALMRLRVEGEPAAHAFNVPEGPIELAFEFTLARATRHPLLRVTHPTWRPHEVTGSADPRELASLLSHAWIEAAPGG